MDDKTKFNDDDLCDLDKEKICDSCEKCLDIDENDYIEITIDGIIKENVDSFKEYEDFEVFEKEDSNQEKEEIPYDFIEDHEELKTQYYQDIRDILEGKK